MSELKVNKSGENWFTEVCDAHGTAFSLRIIEQLAEVQTPYQRIEVFDTTDFGKLMVIDGFVMLTSRDNFIYHEMMTHPVLFTHANPKDVLIVGGGDCGALREVLRHDTVESVVQVDIDEQVTRLAEIHFSELCESNHDSRATLIFDDAIQWVKNAPPTSLDIIIVDSTDPIGPAEGLFSEAFYADCRKALRPGGLIVQQSESPLLHIKLLRDMHVAMRNAGYVDVKTLQFPQPVYPSGWWSATMAMKEKTQKDEKIESYSGASAAEKSSETHPLKTKYYSAEIHRAAFVMPPFFMTSLGSCA